jgi:ribosomal protein L35AE/L33A
MRENQLFALLYRSTEAQNDEDMYPKTRERIDIDVDIKNKCMCIVLRDKKEEICGHPISGIGWCKRHEKEKNWLHVKYHEYEDKADNLVSTLNIDNLKKAMFYYSLAIMYRTKQGNIYNGHIDHKQHKPAIRVCHNKYKSTSRLVDQIEKGGRYVNVDESRDEPATDQPEGEPQMQEVLTNEVKHQLVDDYRSFEELIQQEEVLYNEYFETTLVALKDPFKYIAIYATSNNRFSGISIDEDRLTFLEVWFQIPIQNKKKEWQPGICLLTSTLNIDLDQLRPQQLMFNFGADFEDYSYTINDPGHNKFRVLNLLYPKPRAPNVIERKTHTLLYFGRVSDQPFATLNTNNIYLGISKEDAKHKAAMYVTTEYVNTFVNYEDIKSQYNTISKGWYEITDVNDEIVDEMKKADEADEEKWKREFSEMLRPRPEKPDTTDPPHIAKMKEALHRYGRTFTA